MTRRVQFFGVHRGLDPDTGRWLPFDAPAAFEAVAAVPEGAGRYVNAGEDRVHCWVDQVRPHPRLRFCLTWYRRRPVQEQNGQLSDLPMAPGAGTSQVTHMVFFDNGVVGCEYNHFGARVNVLRHYLEQLNAPALPSVSYLIRQNAAERLRNATEFIKFELKMSAGLLASAAARSPSRGLLNSLHDMHETTGYEQVTVQMSAGRSRRSPLNPDQVRLAGGLLLDAVAARDGSGEQAAKVKITAVDENGAVNVLDLLSERLVYEFRVHRLAGDSERFDPTSVYREIIGVYTQNRQEIEAAWNVYI